MQKVSFLVGFTLIAFICVLFQSNFFSARSDDSRATSIPSDSSAEGPAGKIEEAWPVVRISLDRTSVDNNGSVEVTGTAPAGKPVYLEVWSEEKVRSSSFDTKPDPQTGIRPYVLYMTDQMPAFYRILSPSDGQNSPISMYKPGAKWNCAQTLKYYGAEDAFSLPATIEIRSYKVSLLGSVLGSRGERLGPMSSQNNLKWAMKLVEARFKSPANLFFPCVELKPDGSFSTRINLPGGVPRGRYYLRALVDCSTTSQTVSFENRIKFPYVYLSNAGTSINLFYPFCLSLIVSIFGVLMGAGGGFMLNPLLVSLWPLPHTVVAGTVMPTILFSQGSGIVNYSRIRFINWKLGVSIGLAMVFGGFIGPKLTEMVTVDQYKFVFGWILVVLACLMLWQTTPTYLNRNKKEQAILKEYRKKAEEGASSAKETNPQN